MEVADLRREWREAMVEMRSDMEELVKFKARVEEGEVGRKKMEEDKAKTAAEDFESGAVGQEEEKIGKVQPKKDTDVKEKEDEANVSLDIPTVKVRLVKRR